MLVELQSYTICRNAKNCNRLATMNDFETRMYICLSKLILKQNYPVNSLTMYEMCDTFNKIREEF